LKYRRRTAPRLQPEAEDRSLLVRPQRAVLVGAVFRGQRRADVEEHLEELARLTETAGGRVMARHIQERRQADPACFIGRGKASELAGLVAEHRADVVIFDDDLSPAQVRNLSEMLDARVVDRSGLILDIFARRARSREAKTQVELARLNYLLPRLRGGWTHLSRQEGGIGVRSGIGETQIELDRRIIRRRIHKLRLDLARIESERRLRRSGRRGAVKAALVGYTNAGKTTLFNALTREEAFVEDRLFATLDPLVRRVRLRGGLEALVIDTVGFIRKLPHHLVASFKSTLEEAADADVLLHVVDLSHADYEDQMTVTSEVLAALGMQDRPVVVVFNKADAVADPSVIERAVRLHPDALVVSAAKRKGIAELVGRVEEVLLKEVVERDVRLSSADKEGLSRIYALAEVVLTTYHDGVVDVRFRASRARARALFAGLAAPVAG
jgi:GTP-binding protein HflX